jgi:pilus assembly protein CpaB
MNRARILILLFAIGCAVLAALLARGMLGQQPPTVTEQAPPPPATTTSVLVAAKDIVVGERLNPLSFEWREWPKENVASFMITREARPDAVQELEGARARAQIFLGEPIAERKIVTLKDGGLMSSLLPKGLRGFAIRITERTAASGFILPNDRVDIISSLRVEVDDGFDERTVVFTRTILTNVRVLAINSTISSDTDLSSIGDLETAVVEVDPEQAEILALAEAQGELSLALRSIQETADGDPDSQRPEFSAAAVSGPEMSKITPRGLIDYSCESECLPTVKGLNSPFPLTFRDRLQKTPSNR